MQEFKTYDRVTSVLYPFSGLSKIDKSILKNACDRGTRVHEICDAIMEGIGFEYDQFGGYYDSFNLWANKDFLVKPDRFFCNDYKITGEIDGIYRDGKGLVLFDIKTPYREGKTWKLQASAYAYLARKHGYNITRVEVVKLNKEGKLPTVYTYKEDFKKFVCCLDVYREFFSKENETPLEYL